MLLQALLILFLVTGSLALGLFVVLVVQRLVSMSFEGWLKQRRAELQPVFTQVIVGDASIEDLKRAVGKSLNVAESIILGYLRQLSGQERDRLLNAADALGLIQHNVNELRVFDWHRRDLAAMQLGIYGIPETVPDLVRLLHDDVFQVRYSAARSLGMIDSPEAVEALVSILDQPELVETPRVLEIVQTMENRMSEPLKVLLRSSKHPPKIKLLAIDLVGDLRDTSLLPLLHDILNSSDKEQVVRAVKALGRIAARQSVSQILELAHDREWEVRAQAMKAIGLIQIEEGLPLLVNGLSDSAYWVRRNASEALLSFGAMGVEALREAQKSTDGFARDIAHYQLERRVNGQMTQNFAVGGVS